LKAQTNAAPAHLQRLGGGGSVAADIPEVRFVAAERAEQGDHHQRGGARHRAAWKRHVLLFELPELLAHGAVVKSFALGFGLVSEEVLSGRRRRNPVVALADQRKGHLTPGKKNACYTPVSTRCSSYAAAHKYSFFKK
jgi:hypothetical protein